jgi:hypothetical protein
MILPSPLVNDQTLPYVRAAAALTIRRSRGELAVHGLLGTFVLIASAETAHAAESAWIDAEMWMDVEVVSMTLIHHLVDDDEYRQLHDDTVVRAGGNFQNYKVGIARLVKRYPHLPWMRGFFNAWTGFFEHVQAMAFHSILDIKEKR